jgi:hypothetical protein
MHFQILGELPRLRGSGIAKPTQHVEYTVAICRVSWHHAISRYPFVRNGRGLILVKKMMDDSKLFQTRLAPIPSFCAS